MSKTLPNFRFFLYSLGKKGATYGMIPDPSGSPLVNRTVWTIVVSSTSSTCPSDRTTTWVYFTHIGRDNTLNSPGTK